MKGAGSQEQTNCKMSLLPARESKYELNKYRREEVLSSRAESSAAVVPSNYFRNRAKGYGQEAMPPIVAIF